MRSLLPVIQDDYLTFSSTALLLAAMRFVFRFFVSGFFLLIATCHTVLLLNAQQRWIVRESNTNQNLNAIHFANRLIGCAVGDVGAILTTDDGGLSWNNASAPSKENLLSVFVLNAQFMWIVGAKGTILHSCDGGATWVARNSPIQVMLRQVQFFDAQRGLICGDSATLLSTRNGGVSWQRIATPFLPNQSIRGIAFISDRIGWICGDGAQIWLTRDGGATWREEHSFQDLVNLASFVSFVEANINSISFIDSSNAWAVGSYRLSIPLLGNGVATNIFARTSEQIWNNQLLLPRPITNAISAQNVLRNIRFVNRLRGWACGNEGVFITRDGGQIWSAETGTEQFDLNGIFALDTNRLWAVGAKGVILQYAPLTIQGRIMQDNLGVGGVQVRSATAVAFTDNTGRFELDATPGLHVVIPQFPNFAFFPTSASVEVLNQNVRDVNFAARNAGNIRGRIANTNGLPIIGQTVILYPGQKTARTDSTGEYQFSDLYPTRYQVAPSVSASGAFEPRVATVRVGDSIVTQNFLFREGSPSRYRISGQITTLNNAPLANVRLVIEQLGDRKRQETTTDNNGFYTIEVQSDTYFVTPVSSFYTFQPTRMKIDVNDAPSVQNNFQAGAILRGLIVDKSSVHPISGVRVEIIDSSGFKRRAISNGKGEFRFDYLPTGVYRVRVARDGYGFETSERSLSAPSFDSTFVAFRGSQVSFPVFGRVVNERGVGQEGVLVEIAPTDTTLSDKKPSRVETDADGVFRFNNLSALPYRIQFFSDTLQFSTSSIVHTPQSGDSAEIAPIRAYPLATVKGRVLNLQTQRGVREVKITLESLHGTVSTMGATDGTFRARLRDGNYTLRLERRGYALSLQSTDSLMPHNTIILSNGESKTLNITGQQSGYDLSGRIILGNRPLSGVTIRLFHGESSPAKDTLLTVESDSLGEYFIPGLPSASYKCEFSRKGFLFFPQEATIAVSDKDTAIPDVVARRDTAIAQFYTLERNGVEYLQFDAGDGRLWTEQEDILRLKSVGKTASLSASPAVLLNGFLALENLSEDFSINTRLRNLTASSARIALKNIPFAGKIQDFVLYEGALKNFNLDSAGKLGLSFAKQGLERAATFLGSKLNIKEIEFIGDITNASGIRVVADVELPQYFSCDRSSSQAPTIRLINLEALRSGVKFAGRIERIGPAAQICLDSLVADYNGMEERLAISSGISLPFIANIAARTEMISGAINSIGLRADLNKPIVFGPGAIKGIGGGVENLIAGNFSAYLSGTLVSVPEGVWEFNLNEARYRHPNKFNVDAGIKCVRLVNTWQMEGEAFIDVDLNSYVQFQAVVRAGTFDEGKNYAVEGSAALNYSWNPDTTFVGSIAASVQIPKIELGGIAQFLFSLASPVLPFQIGNVGLKFVSKPRKRALAGEFGLNLAVIKPDLKFTIDMTNEPIKFTFGKGVQDLTEESLERFRRRARLTTSVQKQGDAFNSPMQALSPPQLSAKERPALTASSSETITIDKNFAQVVVRVKSQGAVPTTVLENPNGERFTRSKDSIVAYSISPDRTEAFWIINNPKAGSVWRIVTENPSPSDSIQILAFPKNRPFAIQAETRGNELHVRWETQGASPNATVDVFLDSDNQDGDGIFIGSTTEQSGSLAYRLSDSLSACQYFVYALRDDDGVFTESYAPNPISNFKPALPSPSIIASRSRLTNNQLRLVYLNPLALSQPLAGYAVLVTNSAGDDSIYALTRTGNGMTLDSITLNLPAVGRYAIRLASFLSDGRQGCFSEPAFFTVNALSTSISTSPIHDNQRGPFIAATPNPADKDVVFRLHLPRPGAARLSLATLLGQEIAVVANMTLQGKIDIPFNVSSLSQGVYVYRLEYDGAFYTGKIIVAR